MFHVELPTPISANHLFANVPGRGRVKTKAYENWQNTAALSIIAQVRADRRIGGLVAVVIELPSKSRLDIDNAVKPILDALVRSRRIDDDRNVIRLEVTKGHPGETTVVTVSAASREVVAPVPARAEGPSHPESICGSLLSRNPASERSAQ